MINYIRFTMTLDIQNLSSESEINDQNKANITRDRLYHQIDLCTIKAWNTL
jgi:hypothetical protein